MDGIPTALSAVTNLCRATPRVTLEAVHANGALLHRLLRRHSAVTEVVLSEVALLAATQWRHGLHCGLESTAEMSELCDALYLASMQTVPSLMQERAEWQSQLVSQSCESFFA